MMYEASWFEKLACKLGFHSEWYDTTGHNVGTEETPVYFMETIPRCHRCSWQNPRRGS